MTEPPPPQEMPQPSTGEAHPFPVIGVGASAGGLDALEQFLRAVPSTSGAAFVIIQHLDPTREAILAELLQRHATLPVAEVTNLMPLQRDHVYVIPPDRDLSLELGVFHLLPPPEQRGQRLPIDHFFRSLAAERGELAAGVVLSGMGSDGTLGLAAIKTHGGGVFVQEPGSAAFDAMPLSAMTVGPVDAVAPPAALYERIMTWFDSTPRTLGSHEAELTPEDQPGVLDVIAMVRARTGQDFAHYKRSTLMRRISRRMGIHRLTRVADYASHLHAHPEEADLLFHELLIGVTRFFRDPEAWDEVRRVAIPALIASCPGGGALRAWVPGCSSGEEAYTLAMIFREVLDELRPSHPVTLQIFATDLDRDAIAAARQGIYTAASVAELPEERRRRFFTEDDRGFRIATMIRDMVIFAPQNLVMDPPFTKLDFISCRNLLIYLTPAMHQRILPLFHYSLKPGGMLLLGSAESVGVLSSLFTSVSGRTPLYRRRDTPASLGWLALPLSSASDAPLRTLRPSPSPESPIAFPEEATALLQRHRDAPAVVTTMAGDILHVRGDTVPFLEPTKGKVNWNIFAMAREPLSTPLAEAFRSAALSDDSVACTETVPSEDGARTKVHISVQPFTDADGARSVLVVFTPEASLSPPVPRDGALIPPEGLAEARAALRKAEAEARATHEELASTLEELQSANEELSTSKEEMQSMNEELHTVNHELQSKLDELTLASSDMANLLNSTNIATLFLDHDLRVRRFTTQATQIIRLIPGDVGRPVTDVVSNLLYPEMAEDARSVLHTLVVLEREATTADGRWFSVRIMPYRTHDNRVDGVVLTFSDVTKAKALEAALREAQSKLEDRLAVQAARRPGVTESEAPSPEGGTT